MNTRSFFAFTAACLLAGSALWSVIAAPLAAKMVISVLSEFASRWLALFAAFFGGYLLLRAREQQLRRADLVWRCSWILLVFAVVGVSWRWSDDQFLFWKSRAISSGEWSQMVSDLQALGKEVAERGSTTLPAPEPPPKSLQRLGVGVDYKGGIANVWDTPSYRGVFAVMTFGYKSRSWGLLVGPEAQVKSYCPRGSYFPVSTNAFFFVGPRD